MRYWQSYRFVFDNPNWLKNLALGCVCSLIPWIGQIVLIGYFFEVIDVLLRRRQRERLQLARVPADPMGEWVMDALPVDEDHEPATYPDFDFNRFSEYLTRGIWPFLVRMIANMIVGMLVGIVGMVGFMVIGFAAAAANQPLLLFTGYGLFWLAYSFLMAVAGILTLPLYLRAGLSCDFASAFSMEFYRDFLRRVGKEIVLAELFLMATGILVSGIGLLLCYVGIFPAIALLAYAHHHLDYQLYELYLERGGVPVQRKEKAPPAADDYRDVEPSSPHVMRPLPDERSTDVMRPPEEPFHDY